MTKIKNIVLALLFVFGVSSIASANDIYITQSGDTLDLDITQDGQNNVIGTSTTDVELTGDSMTLTITQTGNSNVAAIDINGNTYTGTLSFTGNSNDILLNCDGTGGTDCETVTMDVAVTGDSADIDITIGSSADAQTFSGDIDITGDSETVTLTVDGTSSVVDIDVSNSLGSSGNTWTVDIDGDGDSQGHTYIHSHTGDGATINTTQSGINDNVINLTTSGDSHEIDITQSD